VNGNDDPTTAKTKDPDNPYAEVAHLTPYSAAVDAQGNADCENGQFGWVDGPLNPPWGRYGPGTYGGNHTITNSTFPTLAGPSWDGVNNVKDVP
jgi:hypothetical protein